jgi:hypothetical protein
MENYGYAFQGEVFTPEGKTDEVSVSNVDARNRETEAKEIKWLKTAPEKVVLYVKHGKVAPTAGDVCVVQTWLGTAIDDRAWMGPRAYAGFGFRGHTYRRAVTCQIFGVLYHGWYMESSGDYCRLKKAKRQGGK